MQSQTQFFLFTALIVAVIVYGSLYPFDFRTPVGGDGAVFALLRSWKMAPSGRGDLVANVLLYIPLGWFGLMSLPPRMSVALRIILMGTCGAMLSLTMELTQYYAASRMTAASDVYANFLGTMVGCLGGIYLSGRWRVPLIAEISTKPIPAGLLVLLRQKVASCGVTV
jgi:VanZ family protein